MVLSRIKYLEQQQAQDALDIVTIEEDHQISFIPGYGAIAAYRDNDGIIKPATNSTSKDFWVRNFYSKQLEIFFEGIIEINNHGLQIDKNYQLTETTGELTLTEIEGLIYVLDDNYVLFRAQNPVTGVPLESPPLNDSQIILRENLDLFIDPDNGSDSNDGMSGGTAFATETRLKEELQNYFLQGGTISFNFAQNTTNTYKGLSLSNLDISGVSGNIIFQSTNGRLPEVLCDYAFLNLQRLTNFFIQVKNLSIKLVNPSEASFNISISYCNNVRLQSIVTQSFLKINYGENINLSGIDVAVNYTGNSTPELKIERCQNISLHTISLYQGSRLQINDCSDINFQGSLSLFGNYDFKFPLNYSHNQKISQSITSCNLDDAINQRLLSMDNCFKARLNFGTFTGTSGVFAGTTSLPVIQIKESLFTDLVADRTCDFSVTGIDNYLSIDKNSNVRLLYREDFVEDFTPYIPYQGNIERDRGSILNQIDAGEISYDSSTSNLSANDLQTAVDNLAVRISALENAGNGESNSISR